MNLKIVPQAVLELTAPDEWIKAQLVKNVAAETLTNSHLNDENRSRRCLVWNGNNVFDEKIKNRLLVIFSKYNPID